MIAALGNRSTGAVGGIGIEGECGCDGTRAGDNYRSFAGTELSSEVIAEVGESRVVRRIEAQIHRSGITTGRSDCNG